MRNEACVPPTGAPLVGRHVRLDVTTPEDAADLFAVYSDRHCYEQGFVMIRPHETVPNTEALVAQAVAARATGPTPYTIRLVADGDVGTAGTVVGTSSLGDVDTDREHVHLGWTMYGSRWWGTHVNPESKLLLVKIQTDVVNARSRAAILKLGATFEGITRRDVRRADGSWRDTAVHSILRDEWPNVRAGLLARLGGP